MFVQLCLLDIDSPVLNTWISNTECRTDAYGLYVRMCVGFDLRHVQIKSQIIDSIKYT